MKPSQAFELAPPTPPCFHDRIAWSEYLAQCQEYGKRDSARPFVGGVYRPAFNFCGDCTPEHASRMELASRCKPAMFRGIAVVTVATAT